jgi:hypothetical protein
MCSVYSQCRRLLELADGFGYQNLFMKQRNGFSSHTFHWNISRVFCKTCKSMPVTSGKIWEKWDKWCIWRLVPISSARSYLDVATHFDENFAGRTPHISVISVRKYTQNDHCSVSGHLLILYSCTRPRSRRLAPAHLSDGISSVCRRLVGDFNICPLAVVDKTLFCVQRRDQDRAPESVARSRSEARGFTRLSCTLYNLCNLLE